jgi:hypothetical protein
MIELALLLGLGAVGYLLAEDNKNKQEGFTSLAPRSTEQIHDEVPNSQDTMSHSNEVPFFGARVTQSMYSGATNGILDTFSGAGKEYFQKREVKSFYDAKPATGNPFGGQVETDFMQSRMVTGQQMKNVFPIEQVHVAPGSNDGYTNVGQGGFQQGQLREFELPKTTDELRVSTKPKLSYEPPVIPGANHISVPGVQAEVKKNRPDRFVLTGMDRVNTTVGAQTAPAIYPNQPMKEQARETTSTAYMGAAGGNAIFASYIRAFTEPFQEFMKLTVEGRPGPAGPQGNAKSVGSDMYSVQTNRDETLLSEATRFNTPMHVVNAHTEHLGSYTYTEPLKQDVHVERNAPELLSAFHSNPYTQSLNSI